MVSVLFALLTALFNGLASVLQRMAAATAPAAKALHLSLFGYLIKHKVWLAGIGFVVLAALCQATALATGAGGLAGPFNAMLYAPDVGHALQELGAAIRFRTSLTPRIRETAILVVAQAWDSAYERSSHELIGRDAGLTEPEIEALRAGTDPGFSDERERVAWSVVRSLVGIGAPADLDDREYDLAVRTLGEQALVELSTLVGYYATLALQMRIFRVDR